MKYKKKSEKKIDEILDGMLGDNQFLSQKYREFDIDKIWRSTFGVGISKYTKEIKLYGKTLTVYIDSAPMKAELMYRKDKILKKLNANLAYFTIEKLIIK